MKAKLVRESLFEVIRAEDEWANQQIAKNVDRYKSEMQEEPEEISEDQEKEEMIKAIRIFLSEEDFPVFIAPKILDEEIFQIDLKYLDEDYRAIQIQHKFRDNDLEYEFFQIFGEAFKDAMKKNGANEIIDSSGNALYVE